MLLEMKSVCKSFLDEQILKNINIEIEPGEVRALIGPNGSGKSTIAKILSGLIQQEYGEIIFDGKHLNNSNPTVVLSEGIFTLYQEHYLLPNMSIADNLFLGDYEKKLNIFVNKYAIKKRTIEVLKKFNCDLSPDTKVENLNLGEQYIVSAAKAFVKNAKLFIFDEPTAGLSRRERDVILGLVKTLKKSGISVLYITHRMSELRKICDSVSIMRDGQIILTSDMNEISDDSIRHMMAVSDGCLNQKENDRILAETVLVVEHLSKKMAYKDISFELKAGEILGLVGTNGSGRTALLKTIFGALNQDSGKIYIGGKEIKNHNIHTAITRYKIGYLPDERLNSGIFPDMTVLDNIMIPKRKTEHSFFVQQKQEMELFIEHVFEEGYFLTDPCKPIKYMSGGNQQKSVFFRWAIANSRIILLDEPTKGIDIASKNEMYNIILERARAGVSFVFCSSDIEELEPICTRILSIKRGQLEGEV